MGTRRVRCLQSLGYKEIYGYDNREDRRLQAKEKYGINIDFCEGPETVFISLPPKLHPEYVERYKDIPCFIEAGTEKLEHGTPSATMLFNPLVKIIQEKLPTIGKIVNITYHCGQYLPDWHPYEKVGEFYAGEVGAKEMVSFELMWFCKLFGYPKDYFGCYSTSDDIEGLKGIANVSACLNLEGLPIASIMVDVTSRQPIRQLVINGTEKQLRYDLNQGVSEQMYVNETKAFMDGAYPNTLEHSNCIIEITKELCPV